MRNCVVLDEPLDADLHVRWYERRRLAAFYYSIVKSIADNSEKG
jgi:hypothetical protein